MQPPNEGQQRPPQPPYYPPPGQQQYGPQYPQQPPPYYPPPPGQAPKKRRRWPIFLLVGALLLCVIIGVAVATSPKPTSTTTTSATSTSAGNTATTVPTKASTPIQQKWTTVRTFSGSSSKKTPFFTVPDDWRLNWTCRGGEFGGNLSVTVYGPGNAYVDLPINTACAAGKTVSDTTEEHQGGSIYLDISALSDWTIQIQELK